MSLDYLSCMFISDEHTVTMYTQTDTSIVEQCAQRLAERLGVAVRIHDAPPAERGDYDYRITLETRPAIHLLTLARNQRRLVREQVHHVALAAHSLMERYGILVLFLAPWIEDTWAEELRAAGVFYADLQGNAYLRLEKPVVQLEIAGRRPATTRKAEPGRLIEASGLKVLHLLLTQPDAIHRPYRRLAQEADVALGTVGIVMRELRLAGYLRKTGPEDWILDQRQALVDLFVRGYALKLRPACLLGTFRHAEKDTRKLYDNIVTTLDAVNMPHALTGTIAAEEWTGHLRGDGVTLHVPKNALPLLRGKKMLPDPAGGNLTLLDFFGPTVHDPTTAKERRFATPLLVYAELLHDGRPREVEAARMIFDRYVRGAANGR